MTDTINEARALLIAHDEGYRVHVGCGGEVDARTMLCAKCDEAIGVGQFAHPDKLSAAAAGYIRALVADLDRTRAELAAAREAIKAVSDLISQSHGVDGLHLNGDSAPWSELLAGGAYEGWLSSLDAYHAAHPAASDYERVTRELADAAADTMARLPSLAERKAKIDALRTARDGVHRPSAAHPAASPAAGVCRECGGSGSAYDEVSLIFIPEKPCAACKGTARAGEGGHE